MDKNPEKQRPLKYWSTYTLPWVDKEPRTGRDGACIPIIARVPPSVDDMVLSFWKTITVLNASNLSRRYLDIN